MLEREEVNCRLQKDTVSGQTVEVRFKLKKFELIHLSGLGKI